MELGHAYANYMSDKRQTQSLLKNNEQAFVTPYLTLTREDAPQREIDVDGCVCGKRVSNPPIMGYKSD